MKDLNDILKNKFDGLETDPPAEVWNNISEHLDRKDNKKRFMIYLQVAATLLLFASIGSVTFYFINIKNKSDYTGKAVPSVNDGRTHKSHTITADKKIPFPSGEQRKINTANVIKTNSNNQSYASNIKNKNTIPANTNEKNNVAFNVQVITQEQVIQNKPDTAIENNFTIQNQYAVIIDSAVKNFASSQDSTSAVTIVKIADDKKDSMLQKAILSFNQSLLETEKKESEKNNGGAWNIGAQMAPLYSYRYSSQNNISSGESGLVSFGGGMNLKYNPESRWQIETGLYYSQTGQKVDLAGNNTFNTSDPINISNNNSIGKLSVKENTPDVATNALGPASSSPATLRQNFGYVDLPLVAKYKIIDRKFDLIVSGGLSSSFLMLNKTSVTDGTGTESYTTENITRMNYCSIVGLGIERKISSRMLFLLEPRFRYFINSVNTEGPDTHPYTFGIFTGLSYFFK